MHAKWLLFIAGIALILAQATAIILDDRLRIAASMELGPNVEPEKKPEPASLAAFLDRNVFRAKRSDREPKRAEPEYQPEDCVPSSLRLIATVIGDRLEECALTVATDEAEVWRLEESNDPNLVVLTIEPGRAVIARGGRCEVLELAPLPRSHASSRGSNPDIRRLAPRSFELKREAVFAALSDVGKLSRDARIVPRVREGRTQGFELMTVRPGGVFEDLGLERGDLIHRVNGYDLADSKSSMEAYAALRDAQLISVELTRKGAPLTIDYQLY